LIRNATAVPPSARASRASIGNDSVGTTAAGPPVPVKGVFVRVGVAVAAGLVGVAVAAGTVGVGVAPTAPAHSGTPFMTWHSNEPISQAVCCGRVTPR
jgi:hypothetical protein